VRAKRRADKAAKKSDTAAEKELAAVKAEKEKLVKEVEALKKPDGGTSGSAADQPDAPMTIDTPPHEEPAMVKMLKNLGVSLVAPVREITKFFSAPQAKEPSTVEDFVATLCKADVTLEEDRALVVYLEGILAGTGMPKGERAEQEAKLATAKKSVEKHGDGDASLSVAKLRSLRYRHALAEAERTKKAAALNGKAMERNAAATDAFKTFKIDLEKRFAQYEQQKIESEAQWVAHEAALAARALAELEAIDQRILKAEDLLPPGTAPQVVQPPASDVGASAVATAPEMTEIL
jgi:hypothetical protein